MNTGIVVIACDNYCSDGSYRYDLMYTTTAPDSATVDTDNRGTITCLPGSTAHKAGGTGYVELGTDGTWVPIG